MPQERTKGLRKINCKVTGCIVTHNNMSSIDETITTLLEQTKGVPFELYVVDNLSTDGTPAHIKEKYPRVKVIEPMTNDGFGSGHNVVLPLIDSDYHCVINPDIILKDDVIAKMAEYMEKNKDIGLLSPKICCTDGTTQVLGKRNPKFKYLFASRLLRDETYSNPLLREYAMLDEDLTVPREIENASGCFMFFRTELFKKIGGFDERYFMYFEDCDITRTVRKQAKAVFYPNAVIYHAWARESKKNIKLLLIHIHSMFKYFIKWRKD